jgi:hypothetical protein
MATRQWRVSGNFHRVGEVAVIVHSPNWQGALRKGALAIKANPSLKGRRLNSGIFTVNEQYDTVEAITGEQASLPGTIAPATGEAPPLVEQVGKCSNPNCNQPFAHEGMCDNAPVEAVEEVVGEQAVEVASETVEPPTQS